MKLLCNILVLSVLLFFFPLTAQEFHSILKNHEREKSIASQLQNRMSRSQPRINLKNNHTAIGGIDTAWVRHYSTGSSPVACYASKISTDASGNIYVAGSAGLIKYNSNGDTVWISRNELLGVNVAVSALTIDDKNNIYISGNTDYYVDYYNDFITIKYTPFGDTAWMRIYSGPGKSNDFAQSHAVDSRGNVYVTGTGDDEFGDWHYLTIKYTAVGELVWIKKYNSPDNSQDHAYSIALDSNGSVYVTGNSGTVKYDDNGTQLWFNSFGGTVIGALSNDNIIVTGSRGIANFTSNGAQQWTDTLLEGGQSLLFDNQSNIYIGGTSQDWINFITKIDTSGKILWYKTTGFDPYGSSIDLDQQGNVYITGMRMNELPRKQSVVLKYGSLGDSIWAQEFTNDQVGFTRALSIGIDLGGNIIVCGLHAVIDPDNSDDFQNGTYLSIKYNSDGLRLWERQYHSSRNYSAAHSFSVDPKGAVYITGSDGHFDYRRGMFHSGRMMGSFWTLKLNDSGSPEWMQKYSSANGIHDEASLLVLDPVGNIIVTGLSYEYNNLPNPTLTTIKNSPTGDTLWICKIRGPGETPIWPRAISADGNGNVFLVGRGNVGYTTVKFNSVGDTAWTRSYGQSGDYYNQPSSIITDTADNVYVTGSGTVKNSASDLSTDYATIKYNSNGECLWVRFYNGTGGGGDNPSAMAQDNVGNIYVTGSSVGSDGNEDIVTIKYTPDGDTVWVRRYIESYARASALAIDSKGNVTVVGTCGGSDFTVIQYSQDGETQWERKYIEPDNSIYYSANSLELDDHGNVYVNGIIYNYKSAAYNSLTIKYSNSGNLEWKGLTSLGEGSYFDPIGIHVDASGDVYVAGTTTIGSESFYTVIKYLQTPNFVDGHDETSPITFRLEHNFPNPFNPSTTLRYALPSSANVKLSIYDLLGRKIEMLVDEEQSAGWKEVKWNATGISGGVYFYRIQAGTFVETKKMMLIR